MSFSDGSSAQPRAAAPPPALVVIGTSMGGLRALELVFSELGADFPLPIAVVQHRGTESESQLALLLQLHCALPVSEAGDKEPMNGGHVYLAPPDYHLLVDDGRFALSTEGRVLHARPSIDVLFESAADSYRDRVLALVLTGASSDGSHGAARIRERGGRVVAQDPETAEAPLMPRSAIVAGAVDEVLPLTQIGAFLNAVTQSYR
jgi:two-component system, chemotaxis family, protein-glutamate methylesterase/glutaminase